MSEEEEDKDSRRMMSWSVAWAAAIAPKSIITGGNPSRIAFILILDKASVGALAVPLNV